MRLTPFYTILFAILVSLGTESEAQHPKELDFGTVLSPHYSQWQDRYKCDQWEGVDIPIFNQDNANITFDYCSSTLIEDHEFISFEYRVSPDVNVSHIYGKLKYPTSQSILKINPKANPYSYMDIALFGVADLGSNSLKENLSARETFLTFDWDICKLTSTDTHIWTIENLSFVEIPLHNSQLDIVQADESREEWRERYKKRIIAKMNYDEKYGEQALKNRACAHAERVWFVVKDNTLVELQSPDSHEIGINPASIKVTYK